MDIRKYLKEHRLLCDGAFGTYFASVHPDIMAEKANTEDSEAVYSVHRAYIEKGARLIRTNTFESNRTGLNCTEAELKENIAAAYDIAVRAAGDDVFVACDIGPGNEEDYYTIADTFIEKGGSIFVFETFSEIEPVTEVIRHIKERKKDAFIITQFCVNQHGYTEEGISARRLMEKAGAIAEIDAMGFNCGIGPGHLLKVLRDADINTDKFITALPNASYPSVIQDRMVFLDNINYYAGKMAEIAEYADILGGCCGTDPRYIKAVGDAVSLERTFVPHRHKAEKTTGSHKSGRSNVFFADKGKGSKIIAVELDPPKNGDCTALMETANYLKKQNVDVITFADSPSGRTRADSVLMSIKVARETGVNVMPHICCRDKNAIGIGSQLLGAYINDIRNFLVITGDPVPSTSRDNIKGVFNFDSVKLMEYIREMNDIQLADSRVSYGGAINYARRNIETEIERIRLKEEAGAEFFLTQPVYDDKDIAVLRDIKKHISSAKMLVGIMPLVSYTNALFIKNELTGITVPRSVVQRFSPDMTRAEAQKVGIDISGEVMDKVYDFADGFYFIIPFNRLSIAEDLFAIIGKK